MVTHHPGPRISGFVCEVWKADFKDELYQELKRAKERWAWWVWDPQLVNVREENGVWHGIFQRYSSP